MLVSGEDDRGDIATAAATPHRTATARTPPLGDHGIRCAPDRAGARTRRQAPRGLGFSSALSHKKKTARKHCDRRIAWLSFLRVSAISATNCQGLTEREVLPTFCCPSQRSS